MIKSNPFPNSHSIDKTADFFKANGSLENYCQSNELSYDFRIEQQKMARAVVDAIQLQYHLAVEAGTGVGKSFAYLVPAILTSIEHNTRTIISTYTITLQEQLLYKDVPRIQKILGTELKTVIVKGRSNYLCLLRLQRARNNNDLFDQEKSHQLEELAKSANDHRIGDGTLQEIKDQPDSEVWSAVCAEHGNCTGKRCPFYDDCYYIQARKEINDAQILIVNHALFFSEMALRTEGATMLPKYETVIFDEAHQMEGTASSHLGLRCSLTQIEYWLRRLCSEKKRGILVSQKDGHGCLLVEQTREASQFLFEEIQLKVQLNEHNSQKRIHTPLSLDNDCSSKLTRLCEHIKQLCTSIEDEDIEAELNSLSNRGLEIRDSIEAFIQQSLSNHVYWIERQGRRRLPILLSAPIDVSTILRETLFETSECVILTSATLAVRGEFDYFLKRIGGESCTSLQVGSPFDYSKQMKIQIPKDLPPPNHAEYGKNAIKAIRELVIQSKARAFVLFTNSRFMNQAADTLSQQFEEKNYLFLIQNRSHAPRKMLELFQAHTSAVLFGLDRFWMGVDIQGEALSHVIITRLPFSVPDHPLIEARFQAIEANGGNAFKEYALPEAVLKFRQGVGRLIRSPNDTGIISILDSRIHTQTYGKLFLESIVSCPIEFTDIF